MNPFVHEFLKRSKLAGLNVSLRTGAFRPESLSSLENIFTKEGNRICRIWVSGGHQGSTDQVLLGKSSTSLQGIAFEDLIGNEEFDSGLISLIPTLRASPHLVTLQCSIWPKIPQDVIHQLAPIFSGLRNLNLNFTLSSPDIIRPVLDLLHDNVKLQNLQIKIDGDPYLTYDTPNLTTLPELQFLSTDNGSLVKQFRAPKLSCLSANCTSLATLNYLNHLFPEEFDFSSFKYLYVLNVYSHLQHISLNCSVLGSKGRLHVEPSLPTETEYFVDTTLSPTEKKKLLYERPFPIKDILVDICPRDRFCLQLQDDAFGQMLQPLLSLILPRSTNVIELYLFPIISEMSDIITRVPPSVEKLIIQNGGNLIDSIRFLTDTSFCPRLKHLSYKNCIITKDLPGYPDDVGRTLTECL
ncbi:hypothetical protein Clacol_010304 [Clathrus columnatus]|uniref:Uncharacterized protein n=1 Tax=Clathrus columnatus TaxID=1419009 RepID=A0AAV5ATG3_9AGAM|nr:hypothetical protein Clacol_010304 [Clathrus columnatus]